MPYARLTWSPDWQTPGVRVPGRHVQSNTAQTLTAALAYAEHGWRVFVLSAQKRPLANCPQCPPHGPEHNGEDCPCLTCHGFYAATTDPARICTMIARHPDGMLAIRTGAPSGLAVLDIDDRHGGLESYARLETAVGVLPGTVYQYTPGGMHVLYRHPGHHIKSAGKAFGEDMPGLDVKADGGYIVVAPSITEAGKRYRFAGDVWKWDLPIWPAVLTRLTQSEPPPRRPVMSEANRLLMHGGGSASGYAAAALAGEVEQLRTAAPGNRNAALNTAALKLGQLVGGGVLDRDQVVEELTAAALECGLTMSEIGDGQYRGTLASGLNAGVAQPRTGGAA